jgi:arabinan endo-1,5-alpha-L-arabinosidase
MMGQLLRVSRRFGVRSALGLVPWVVMAAASPLAGQIGDVRDVPDPAVIQSGDQYYVFSTAPGIEIRRSDDLWEWELVGKVFDTPLPEWAEREVPGTEFPWAPDITYFGGRYHLYYSLSTFGGQRSVIAVASNETLDPSDADYRWVDGGKVIESNPGQDPFNAIDPAIVMDEQDRVWMAWGSFWGGIKMRRIDPTTGNVSSEDTTTYALAARDGIDAVRGPRASQAIEGPYIIRHDGWYWLFVSFDACCRGAESTYNVRVGRSRAITGPYVDRDGVAMTEGGGTLVMAGVGEIAGPGHNSILTDDGGRHFIVHHFVNVAEGPASPDAPLAIPRSLQIRPLFWAWDGWPIAGLPITGPQ